MGWACVLDNKQKKSIQHSDAKYLAKLPLIRSKRRWLYSTMMELRIISL